MRLNLMIQAESKSSLTQTHLFKTVVGTMIFLPYKRFPWEDIVAGLPEPCLPLSLPWAKDSGRKEHSCCSPIHLPLFTGAELASVFITLAGGWLWDCKALQWLKRLCTSLHSLCPGCVLLHARAIPKVFCDEWLCCLQHHKRSVPAGY